MLSAIYAQQQQLNLIVTNAAAAATLLIINFQSGWSAYDASIKMRRLRLRLRPRPRPAQPSTAWLNIARHSTDAMECGRHLASEQAAFEFVIIVAVINFFHLYCFLLTTVIFI